MKMTQQIESFARGLMTSEIAHGFDHVHRVRNWALKIAAGERYPNAEAVEAAALLHDIGLSRAKDKRRLHGEIGAEMARDYLLKNALFPPECVSEIANAIRYHCANRSGSGQLLDILRDADMIDCLGAMGVIRTVRYWWEKPDYDPNNVRGATWQMAARDFDDRFDKGVEVGGNIVDHLNFQISCFDNLATETGRRIAAPLTQFLRAFILELEAEVLQTPVFKE